MNKAKSLLCSTGVATMIGMISTGASAFDFKDVFGGNIDFSINGYAKLSTIWTDTSDGKIAGGATGLGRNIYLPSATPVGGGDGSTVLDMTARESRINFKANTKGGDHTLGVFLEMDFLTTEFGNEIVSNSYSPRMRHYFMTYDNWLFGQTWSTFMDTGALPDALDFLGAPEGTVFIRQPMVRYGSGAFQVALENPETFTSGGASSASDDNVFPDLTGNYQVKGDWGHARINGLLRQLKVDTGGGQGQGAQNIDDETVGWGVGFSGKVNMFEGDDIRFAVNYGDGMGRYTSIGAARDAVIDTENKLDTVKSLAAFIAYRHLWNARTRSSVIYSMLDVDNPDSGASSLNDKIYSVQVNLIYSPVKQIDFGILYLFANRKEVSGADGDLNRIQMVAKYSF